MQEGTLAFRDVSGIVTTRQFGNFKFLHEVKKGDGITDEQDVLLVKLVNAAGISDKRKVFVPNLERNPDDKAKVVVVDKEPKTHYFAINLWYNFLKLEEPGDAVIVLQPEEKGVLLYSADCPTVFLDIKHLKDGRRALVGIHAGWRGLTQGIIENVIKKLIELDFHPRRLRVRVAVSPHIRLCCSEYGKDVFPTFFRKWKPYDYLSYYRQDREGRVWVNFLHIIQGEIQSFFETIPITPEAPPYCTCCRMNETKNYRTQEMMFYSHRAESRHTDVGRFAVLALG